MQAPVYYMILAWAKPETVPRFVDWLDTAHIPEMLEQPGFLWVRRLALHEVDDEGRPGTMILYGMADQAALDEWLACETRQKMLAEWRKFPNLKLQRLSGDVALTLPSLA